MQKYFLSFIVALALHLSIIGLFMLNISADAPVKPLRAEIPEIISARILDENLVEAKAQELKQQKQDKKRYQQQQKDDVARQIKQEKKRLQQAKERRILAEKQAKKQTEQRKKAAQEEQNKLQAIKQKVASEKKRQLEKKQKRLAEGKKQAQEKKRKAEAQRVATAKKEAARKEAAKQEKKAAEKRQQENEEQLRIAAAKQAQDDKIRAANVKIAQKAGADAKALIKRKVTQNWHRPSSVSGKLACTIKVGLIPSGDVMTVNIVKSSGNALFDASVERAVYKASPLPVPKDPEVFKQFRRFKFVFSPG